MSASVRCSALQCVKTQLFECVSASMGTHCTHTPPSTWFGHYVGDALSKVAEKINETMGNES